MIFWKKNCFEVLMSKRARNRAIMRFLNIFGKSARGIFLTFLMKSQHLKDLKLTAKTFLGKSCYGGTLGKKRLMDIFSKYFGGIVNYNCVKVENCVK